MKTIALSLTILTSILLLTGCFFKNPLYTDKDLIEMPEIIGDWEALADSSNAKNKTLWTVAKHDDKVYKVMEVGSNPQNRDFYLVRFLKLNGELLMDLQRAEGYKLSLSPAGTIDFYVKAHDEGHIFAKVAIDSTFKMILFNPDYFLDLAKKNSIKLAYDTYQDNSSDYNTGAMDIISEPTEKLQKLIAEHWNEPKAFLENEKLVFKRKTK